MSKLHDIISEYVKIGIPEQIDYDKLYLYSIVTHSTAVEGSTVTEIENKLLFDEGVSPNKPLEEQLMNIDLKNAYIEAIALAKQHTDFSVKLLCHLSSMVMNNTGTEYHTALGKFSSIKGELRLLNVTAGRGGKSYMSYEKVPQRLEDFCNWLNTQRKRLSPGDTDNIYKLSFLSHYNLVTIHPWADGNGRMARLVMNMLQTEFDVIPSIVKKDSREQYIKSLAQSQEEGNPSAFLDFMLNNHIENLLVTIKEYKNSLKNDTLNLENDTLNLENDTLKLSKNELSIIKLIKENSYIKITEITKITGLSRPTVMRTIRKLKEKHLLSREGAKKNGKWIISPDS